MKKEKTNECVVTVTLDDLCGVSEADIGYYICPSCGCKDIKESAKKCPECGVRFLWDFEFPDDPLDS